MLFLRIGMLVLAAAAGFPRVASAQEARPPVELGLGLSSVITTPYEDFFTNEFASPAVDVRLTVPMSPRFSFDANIGMGHRSSEHFRRFEGLYSLQIKQRLRSATRGSFHAFLTYGLAGYYARTSQEEVRSTQPDGSVFVSPAFKNTEWEAPLATLAGGGVQFGIARRASVRIDAQMVALVVLPLGVRVAGSLSIPLGRLD